MQCTMCKYTHRSPFNYCPMCGQDQLDLRFNSPGFAIVGRPFSVVVNMTGQHGPRITHVEYSGQKFERSIRVLKDGDVLDIEIDEIPLFNNKQLTLHFDGYPPQTMELELIDPAEISFKVQGMYNLKPFVNHTPSILSFSLYDKFILELSNVQSFWQNCSLELETPDAYARVMLEHSKFVIPENAFEAHFDNETAVSAVLRVIVADTVLVENNVLLDFNKIPCFEIANEQEIINANFNVNKPEKPFSSLTLKIQADRTKAVSAKIVGSDLKSFRISSPNRCLAIDGRNRFENTEDLFVTIGYVPGILAPQEILAYSNMGQFDFYVDLEIQANKQLPITLKKRFNFALPIQSSIQRSVFGVLDFGTTNSCIVDETMEIIPTEKKNLEHKTRIEFIKFDFTTHSDHYEFPQSDALGDINTAMNFKSMLIEHSAQSYMFKDNHGAFKGFTPLDLTSIYLRYLAGRLESHTGKNPQEIVATYPAVFNKKTKNAYLQLIRDIGYTVEDVSCITEPEAIAFYYLNHNKTIRQKAIQASKVIIAVFDCGGGTTDYAIVEYALMDEIPVTRVLASWGTEKFGGVYLSYALAKCDINETEKVPDDFGSIYNDSEKAKYFRDKYTYYEKAKLELSEALSIEDRDSIKDRFHKYIRKAYHNDWVSNYREVFIGSSEASENQDIRSIRFQLSQISNVFRELFQNNLLNAPDADYVILAGNSCRLPLFKYYAELDFGQEKVIMDTETIKTSVALGAYTYRSRGVGMVFEGLRRSNLLFYRYSPLGEKHPVYKRWLDMTQENYYPAKNVQGIVVKGYSKIPIVIFCSDMDENEARAFELKLPEEHSFTEASLELRYSEFKIFSRWQITKKDGEVLITEWLEEYNHE